MFTEQNKNKRGEAIIIILILFVFAVVIGEMTKENKYLYKVNTEQQNGAQKMKDAQKTGQNNKTEQKKDMPVSNKEKETTKNTSGKTTTDNTPKTIQKMAEQEPMSGFEIIKNLFQPEEKKISFEEINKNVRAAMVNILCTTKSGGYLNPLSGSGIIIDAKGVILTNAHVAQYFLLKDYSTADFITCAIRTGSPTKPAYKAVPIYISEQWIKNNYKNITQDNYSESGESDYALLLITEMTDKELNLPQTFNYIDYETENLSINLDESMIIAGYPAGFLGGITIQKDLYLTATIEQVLNLYTFGQNTLDLISLGGTILAQKGTSGGAVVNSKNKLVAVAVTSTNELVTNKRDLRAITVSHINRSLTAELGVGLKEFLSINPLLLVEMFEKNKAPLLKEYLAKALERN